MLWMSACLRDSNFDDDASTIDEIENSDQLIKNLADGVILVRLANCIRPNTIKKYNKIKSGTMSKFKRLENIQKFTTACRNHFELLTVFASSDLEVGGFGGNGSANVISTLKCLREHCTAASPESLAAKRPLVEIEGYPEEEECFYTDDAGDVQEVLLSELRFLYESDDMEERLLGSTQVSFGEDWKSLSKWLGPRKNQSDAVPLWKQKKGGVGGGDDVSGGRGGGGNRDPPPRPKTNSASLDKVMEAQKQPEIVDDVNGEKWYFEDDDFYPVVVAGPFALDQMQIWCDMGKIRDEQICWLEIDGVVTISKQASSDIPVLSEEPVPVEGSSTLQRAPPPPKPSMSQRALPPKPPTKPRASTSEPARPEQHKDVVVTMGERKEYRRGLLGKFARSRKRHSRESRNTLFRSKNWKRRFFILHGAELEYYETRTKFIRRKARSGGIKLEKKDYIVVSSSTSSSRYSFDLMREDVVLLRMFAEDVTDRKLWVEALEKCVQELGMSGNPMV